MLMKGKIYISGIDFVIEVKLNYDKDKIIFRAI